MIALFTHFATISLKGGENVAPKKSKHNVLPAGKQIRSKKIPCGGQTSETQKLIHELQVHRIQLEKTVSLLRGTLESTADGILVVNNEGKIESFNQRFIEMWGIPESIVASRDDNRALAFVLGQLKNPDEFLRKVRELYADPDAESFDVLEFEDGRYFERYSRPQKIGEKSVGRVWSFRDITTHQHVEEALRKEKMFSDKVINSLPGIFYLFDEKGRMLRWNKNAEIVSGYSSDEIEKMNPLDFFSGEEKKLIGDAIREVFAKGQSNVESNLVSKDGRMIPHYFTGLRFISDNRRYLIGTGIDISKIKLAEEALQRTADELARSNADLKQFAYVASHDLREPLRSITGFAKLLQKRYKGKLDEKADEFIDYISDGVKRMEGLIRDLLEYSQVDRKGKDFAPVNCSVALQEAINNLRSAIEESGAELSYDLLPTVIADFSHLSRLFQNLISNAIKFRSSESLKIRISARQKGDEWIFSVRDNGIGIDPQFFERIFLIFQRLHTAREYEGTGLGLAICKKIVERHGGQIWVESAQGKGSTFYFTIPVRRT
jgi:PAS domain S-box-containing protein